VSKHDRNSDGYKQWRKAVFVRDRFQCQHCGTKKDIQAHHIKSWMRCEELRYDVSNGITLCRSCHLKAHRGCWKNG
jgi:5-methylcytosine-specific restriction endonuclease McrA